MEEEDEEDTEQRQIRYAAEGDTQLAGDEAWAADTDNTNFQFFGLDLFQVVKVLIRTFLNNNNNRTATNNTQSAGGQVLGNF